MISYYGKVLTLLVEGAVANCSPLNTMSSFLIAHQCYNIPILYYNIGLLVSAVKCFHFVSHLFQCTAHPLLVNDSGLTSNPPYINASVNSLCQDDNYSITVEFGVRSGSMGCTFQQNVTAMNGTAEAPSNISHGDHCYRAVLRIGDEVIAGI